MPPVVWKASASASSCRLLQEALPACPALLSLDALGGRLRPGPVRVSASGSGSARPPARTRWGAVAGRLRCGWGAARPAPPAPAGCRPRFPQGAQGPAHAQRRREGGAFPQTTVHPDGGGSSRRRVLGRPSPSLLSRRVSGSRGAGTALLPLSLGLVASAKQSCPLGRTTVASCSGKRRPRRCCERSCRRQ